MKVKIHHELPGRLRLCYNNRVVKPRQAILAQTLIAVQEGISNITVNPTVGSFLIYYDSEKISRDDILHLFAALTEKYLEDKKLLQQVAEVPQEESIFGVVAQTLLWHYLKRWFLPSWLRLLILYKNVIPRIVKAFYSSLTGRFFSTDLLDATALTVSIITGDSSTASTVNMLLNLGDEIEEITKRRSYSNLAQTLLQINEPVHLLIGKEERSVPVTSLNKGDKIIVRAGSQIPVDGVVESGEGMVNQASITGESLPVEKKSESSVFAGTILEEGELIVIVNSIGKDTKVNNIISMIDNSQNLKAKAQKRSEEFADKIVPFNFLLTGLTWLITRNVTKTVSTLMVDYSCAMKLSAPISVLSAMREAATLGISVKGGKYLEAAAEADTVIFDKTGTLTFANPSLEKIYTFENQTVRAVLTLAACLEEHFPHPLGRAVVEAAAKKGFEHPEYHTKVEYIVAHGIASSINGKKTCIGSAHFIFEDEQVPQNAEVSRIQSESLENGWSLLYLSLDGQLVGILAIGDPVRPNAKQTIHSLKKLGIKRCIMITGDTEGAAKKIASEAGLDAWHSQALPEDKVKFVNEEHSAGHKIIMIGDGINDAPALSAAEVGISVDGCSSIAGDTADINLSHDGLSGLVTVRKLGQGLLQKIDYNDHFIIGFNSMLLALGIIGVLPPTLAAILHNSVTVGISLASMRPILNEESENV